MGDGFELVAAPARSYAEAVARIGAMEAADALEPLNPVSRSRFFGHGAPTARAVVLFHGLTNSPQQFVRLGEQLHALGCNVLIPRLPQHGHADRLSEALGALTAEALLVAARDAVDAAQGLGGEVVVMGLSAGGALAAWAAQERADVARALVISPFLGIYGLPAALHGPLRRLARQLPNRFMWWDPRLKDEPVGPLHAYPRFSTRALAESLRVAAHVLREAERRPPACRQLVVVTNQSDVAIHRGLVERLARAWEQQGASVQRHHFEGLPPALHDLIDPDQRDQRTEEVYPILLDLALAGGKP